MEVRRGDIIYLNYKEREKVTSKNCQNFNRPFLVVSNDLGNSMGTIFIAVPLTSQHKRLSFPTHCVVNFNESVAICEQIFTFNKQDVMEIKRHLNDNEMYKVNACLKIALGVN